MSNFFVPTRFTWRYGGSIVGHHSQLSLYKSYRRQSANFWCQSLFMYPVISSFILHSHFFSTCYSFTTLTIHKLDNLDSSYIVAIILSKSIIVLNVGNVRLCVHAIHLNVTFLSFLSCQSIFTPGMTLFDLNQKPHLNYFLNLHFNSTISGDQGEYYEWVWKGTSIEAIIMHSWRPWCQYLSILQSQPLMTWTGARPVVNIATLLSFFNSSSIDVFAESLQTVMKSVHHSSLHDPIQPQCTLSVQLSIEPSNGKSLCFLCPVEYLAHHYSSL